MLVVEPAVAQTQPPPAPGAEFRPASATQLTPQSFLPIAITSGASSACATTSANAYTTIPIEGGVYKNNAITDENVDFRLSILGFTQVNEPLQLVDYGGSTDANAPRLHGLFEPNRVPAFARAHRRYDWNWNESTPPPYGARGGVNMDWAVSVLDLSGTPGEVVHIPERSPIVYADGNGDYHAMVLYASERELTLAYTRNDNVLGYVVHLVDFCVDPNLVALYRAQLGAGKRSTGRLPGLRNNQPIGTLLADTITVAIRDQGAFLDPRSRKDWWQGISTANLSVVRVQAELDTGGQ